ncbi:MAG: hypothetical protein B6242_01885 [Anaerolineaceae bacterium 4572_78]|nr:MAG: hypothetical protein B6242_01885 [Anaerolineaceae bacterium 4572_78]
MFAVKIGRDALRYTIMRKFFSYGPLDKDLYYYVPRTKLIDFGLLQLLGENPKKGGHYITVWAPRQQSKTWIMANVLWRLMKDDRFDVVKLNIQDLQHSLATTVIFLKIP